MATSTTPSTGFGLVIASTPELFAECIRLRKEVFVQEQGYLNMAEDNNPEDTNATHFLLRQKDDKGTVHYIGAARAIRLPILPVTYDVGRICLTKKARAVGAGSILLTFLEQWVWDNGGDKMTGEAHKGFDGFYRKHGHYPEGRWYVRPSGVPHIRMAKYRPAKL